MNVLYKSRFGLINVNTALSVILVFFIMSLGIIFRFEVVSLAVIAVVIGLMFVAYGLKKNSLLIPKTLIICLVFQNFVLGFVAHLSGNSSSTLSYLTQIPTVLSYITAFVILIRKKLNALDICWLILLLWLIFSIIMNISSTSITGIINYFRNYSIFYCFYLIGRKCISDRNTLNAFLGFVENLAVVTCLIGFVFNMLSFSVLEQMGICEVYVAKGAELTSSSFSGRFTTDIFSMHVVRIGSVMYEPINFGYFLIVPLVYSFMKLKKHALVNTIKFVIIVVGFITTFAKGAFLIIAMLAIIYCLYNIFYKYKGFNKYKKQICLSIIFFSAICIICGSFIYYDNIGGAVNTHFWAIERTFRSSLNSPIFGYGLGSGGNYGSQESGWLDSGGESGLMSIIYQMGYPFAILLIAIFIKITTNIVYQNKHEYFMLAFLPVCFIVASLFQENTFSPQCIGLMMIVAGALSNRENQKKGKIKNGSQSNKLLLVWKQRKERTC